MTPKSKHNIRKNWLASFDLIKTRPIVLLPFIYIAFLEALAIELIYFSSRKPILLIAGPIVRKFFGAAFLHYPANLVLLPRLFYYAQIVIYIFIGVVMNGICVNIFKNVKEGLPVKRNALVKNALKRYPAFFGFGVVMIVLVILVKKLDIIIFSKCLRLVSKYLPEIILKLSPLGLSLFLFMSNVIIQVFSVLAIPILVIRKKPLLKALAGSVYLGLRNFPQLFALIFLPFFVYLPVTLLKGAPAGMVTKIFPESILVINVIGIAVSMFVDCFIIVCACQWLRDRE